MSSSPPPSHPSATAFLDTLPPDVFILLVERLRSKNVGRLEGTSEDVRDRIHTAVKILRADAGLLEFSSGSPIPPSTTALSRRGPTSPSWMKGWFATHNVWPHVARRVCRWATTILWWCRPRVKCSRLGGMRMMMVSSMAFSATE